MLGMIRDICKIWNLVFIDESRKALKEYGGYIWTSLKNVFHNIHQKVQKVLFLAKDLEGGIIGFIIDSFANTDKFLGFLFFLCLGFEREGKRQVIIIMYNARYHKSKMMFEMIGKISEASGAKIFHLPKQSSCLNPVESSWSLFRNLSGEEIFKSTYLHRNLC